MTDQGELCEEFEARITDEKKSESAQTQGTEATTSTDSDLLSVLRSSAPVGDSDNVAMIAFVIPLTFALGIPHHSTFMIIGDEDLTSVGGRTWLVTEEGPEFPDFGTQVGVSIRVWRPRKTDILMESLMQDMTRVVDTIIGNESPRDGILPDEEVAGTVLEASTVLYLEEAEDDLSAAISRAFDRSIDSISLLLRAFRIALGDPRILPIGRLSIPPSIPFVVRYGDLLDDRYTGQFWVNLGESLPYLRTEDVSQEVMTKALERIRLAKHDFPIFAAEDAHARAKRSFFVESDYAATTVFAYSAVEIFCNGLLSLLAWESGRPRLEVVQWLEGQGFESRMRTKFSPFLGGNWDFKSSASPIHGLDDVANIRHRYLHAGAEPSMMDADKALEAFSVVTEFAKDRLAIKAYDFPRTAALIMGEPGLRRKNALTRRLQKKMNGILDEDDWVISFSTWVTGSQNGS